MSIAAALVRRLSDRTRAKGCAVKMMPYGSYQLWQLERSKTDAERRQANAELAMQAAAVSQFFRGIAAPVRSLRRHWLLHRAPLAAASLAAAPHAAAPHAAAPQAAAQTKLTCLQCES